MICNINVFIPVTDCEFANNSNVAGSSSNAEHCTKKREIQLLEKDDEDLNKTWSTADTFLLINIYKYASKQTGPMKKYKIKKVGWYCRRTHD